MRPWLCEPPPARGETSEVTLPVWLPGECAWDAFPCPCSEANCHLEKMVCMFDSCILYFWSIKSNYFNMLTLSLRGV